jgi:hypothetical protein
MTGQLVRIIASMWNGLCSHKAQVAGAVRSSGEGGAAGHASQPGLIGNSNGPHNSHHILKICEACLTGTKHKWRVQRAAAVEKALLGAPASLGSVLAAVKAVSSDVQPGKMPDAEFLASTAEGLLFEALVRTLGLVCSIPDTELLLELPI